MAKRVSDEIDGVDVFTYDTDLLAEAHKLTRPELIDLVRHRKYTGLAKFRKADLAIIYADTLTAERDEQRKLPEINAQTLREQYEGTAARFNPEVIDGLHEQAAAIDEKRTIARAYLCTPSNVVLPWSEIEQGYLDAMAERDRIEHNQAVRAQTERDKLIAKGRKLGLTEAQLLRDTDDLLSLLNNPPTVAEMIKTHPDTADVDDLGRRVQTTASGHLISLPAPADKPLELDTWLTHGMVLVGPQTGIRYRFIRWDRTTGRAVLRDTETGDDTHVHQADVTTWQYLPKASAEGIAAAKRRVPWRETFLMHERTGEVYRILGMDNIVTGQLIISHACGTKCSEHERAISPDVLKWDYRAVCAHGGTQGQCLQCALDGSEPTYAVGDRVRWTEDRRPMFVRHVTPTGAYVAPTMDGALTAFAAFEELSPGAEGPKSNRLQIFTAGELYAVPEMPKPDVTLNLARLLDDPARRLPAELVMRNGTHPEVFSFVFDSAGAHELFAEIVWLIGGMLKRGPVVLLMLCRGGKHRSVAFGKAIADHFGVQATHFHKDLVPYGPVSS